jgi:hypothetical protein
MAQKANQDLTADQATHYEVVKKEILRRYDYTLINKAQRFHDWAYDLTATPDHKCIEELANC